MYVLDTPDAPHGLVVEQGAGSHVSLSWLSPLNDGGSMVTEYLVEKKDKVGDKWIKVATTRYLILFDFVGIGILCSC